MKYRHAWLVARYVVFLVPLCVHPSQLLAEESSYQLESVVVTAQKREEDLYDVPISTQIISSETLVDNGISDLQQVSEYVPNFTLNKTGISTTIAIRGVSSGVNQGFEQSVGQYVDGVYYGRAPLFRAPFFDMERVEVLRGPQSILFGKNSIAGSLSLVTSRPTDEFESDIRALYEPDHGEQDLRAVVSGPLSETLSGRLALMDRRFDGYFHNSFNNQDETDENTRLARGTLRWQPNQKMTATLKLENSDVDTIGMSLEAVNPIELPGAATSYANTLAGIGAILDPGGGPYLETSQNYNNMTDFQNSSDSVTNNVTLTIDYALDDHQLTLVTGYNEYEFDQFLDIDYTAAPIATGVLGEEFDQTSQEIRLASPPGKTIEYIGGLYYQQTDMRYTDTISVPDNSFLQLLSAALLGTSTQREMQQDTQLWSAFLQATWNINYQWRLTAGGRYSKEKKEASRSQSHIDAAGVNQGTNSLLLNTLYDGFGIEPYDMITSSRDESSFIPLIRVQHDMSDDVMLYAGYTEGFKSGGFDARSNAHPNASYSVPMLAGNTTATGVFEFDAEEAESIEVGGKLLLADGKAQLNVALFRTEYQNLQTSQFDGILGFNVTNVGKATSQGIEIDGRWRATRNLTLTGSLAYLDFEYDQFPNAQCAFGQAPNSPAYPGLCDISGSRGRLMPEYQGHLGFEYNRPVLNDKLFRSGLDLIFTDEYFTTPQLDQSMVQDAYTKVNARLSLGSLDGLWELSLLGQNLTDENIISFANRLPVSTSLTGGLSSGFFAYYDRPRSIALQAIVRF